MYDIENLFKMSGQKFYILVFKKQELKIPEVDYLFLHFKRGGLIPSYR